MRIKRAQKDTEVHISGWWFGTWLSFFHINWEFHGISSSQLTNSQTIIFQVGVGQPVNQQPAAWAFRSFSRQEQPAAYVELALSSASVADTFGMILASGSVQQVGDTMVLNLLSHNIQYWWVVWNMAFIFPYIGIIIPTDFHIFQRGSNHQPEYIYSVYIYKVDIIPFSSIFQVQVSLVP